jgi:hypothetical protein
MKTIDEKQVIAFLRSKANACNAAADALEGKIPAEKTEPTRVGTRTTAAEEKPAPFTLVTGHPTVEEVRKRVAHKSARISGLAHHFNCTEDVIRAIIADPISNLTVIERGWVKIEDEDLL